MSNKSVISTHRWWVVATVEYTLPSGWRGSRQVATFMIDNLIAGRTTREGVREHARDILMSSVGWATEILEAAGATVEVRVSVAPANNDD